MACHMARGLPLYGIQLFYAVWIQDKWRLQVSVIVIGFLVPVFRCLLDHDWHQGHARRDKPDVRCLHRWHKRGCSSRVLASRRCWITRASILAFVSVIRMLDALVSCLWVASRYDFDFRLLHSRTHSSAYNTVVALSLLHGISSHLLMGHLGLHVLQHGWQVARPDRFTSIVVTLGILAYGSPLALSGVRGATIVTRLLLLQGKTIGARGKSTIFPLFIVVHKSWLVLT